MKYFGICALLAFCALGRAQPSTGFQIQDGQTIVGMADVWMDPTHAGVPGEFRTRGAGSTDFCGETWWWYRIEGLHSREWALANANGTTVNGNTATTSFTLNEFDSSIKYTVRETGPDTGSIIQDLTVANTTSEGFTIHLYSYWRQAQSVLNSSSLGPNHMSVRHNSLEDFVYTGFGADAWQASAYPDLLTQLRNEQADNYNNTGLPLFQDEFLGGFQWSIALDPGEVGTVRTQFEQVPEPSTLIGLGLAMLLALPKMWGRRCVMVH